MAMHSSILAWRIPWTVEPGGLQAIDGKIGRNSVTNTKERSYPPSLPYRILLKVDRISECASVLCKP